MAEGAQGRKEVEKIRPPLFVLGYVSGGHRAHRSMKRGFHLRCLRTPKGVCVRMSKNLREQFQPMNRGQPAMLASMSSSSKGLAKKPSAPALTHAFRTSGSVFELMIKTFEFER